MARQRQEEKEVRSNQSGQLLEVTITGWPKVLIDVVITTAPTGHKTNYQQLVRVTKECCLRALQAGAWHNYCKTLNRIDHMRSDKVSNMALAVIITLWEYNPAGPL